MATVEHERETVRAQARYVRCSARKARLVLEHIRGLPATEARSVLAFQPRAAARDAGKVLASAIANAENNSGHDADDLIVWRAYADEGPILKRWRARARGRVNRIRKRTCHITITLAVAEPGEITRRRPAPAPEAEAEAPKPSRRPRSRPRTQEPAAEPQAEAAAEEAAETEAAEEAGAEAAAEAEAAAAEEAQEGDVPPAREQKKEGNA